MLQEINENVKKLDYASLKVLVEENFGKGYDFYVGIDNSSGELYSNVYHGDYPVDCIPLGVAYAHSHNLQTICRRMCKQLDNVKAELLHQEGEYKRNNSITELCKILEKCNSNNALTHQEYKRLSKEFRRHLLGLPCLSDYIFKYLNNIPRDLSFYIASPNGQWEHSISSSVTTYSIYATNGRVKKVTDNASVVTNASWLIEQSSEGSLSIYSYDLDKVILDVTKELIRYNKPNSLTASRSFISHVG